MPNPLAYLVLLTFPLVVVVLFRRLPLPHALIWSLTAGYLILPTRPRIDLPLLPAYDRDLAPVLAAALMCLVVAATPQVRRALRAALPARKGRGGTPAPAPADPDRTSDPTVEALRLSTLRKRHPLILLGLAMLALSPVATVLTNGEPVLRGPIAPLPALRPYDIGNIALNTAIMLLPFLLGRRYLASVDAHRTLLRALALSALVYTLPALFEVRMSPQLNTWIYGYFPHQFAQHMRGGGFRPLVFLEHGLRLGMYFATAAIAIAVLWREARGERPARRRAGEGRGTDGAREPRAGGKTGLTRSAGFWALALAWTCGTLLLTKTLGPFVLAFLLVPVALASQVRGRLLVAALLAAMVIGFPILRGAGLVPTNAIVAAAEAVSPDRADSVAFRFRNEDALLDRAAEKPLAGWGTFGRNELFDPITGRDLTTVDGTWIITISIYGWLGYLGVFGLLTAPILLLWRRRAEVDPVTAGLALVLAANLADLLPNSSLTPLTWLAAGALVGRLEVIRAAAPAVPARVRHGTVARPPRPGRPPPRPPVPPPAPEPGAARRPQPVIRPGRPLRT